MPEITETIFKKPPANEVRLGVQFQNSLEVADSRSKFHAQVKKDFPHVVMPELKNLTFYLADYSLHSENNADHLAIGMNYFRLVTTSYPGFNQFGESFRRSLSIFVDCYEIKSFLSFAMSYHNILPVGEFESFEDCFSIQVVVPGILQNSLWAARGRLIFNIDGNYVTVDLEPRLENDKLTSYTMNLLYATQGDLRISSSKNEITQLMDSSHNALKQIFFSILQERYISYLANL